MTEPMKINFIERTTLKKYPSGVDPKDPGSIPEEVLENCRVLTPGESVIAIQVFLQLQATEYRMIENRLAELKEELATLDRRRAELNKEVR